ncbi:protein kinase [Frankia sp. CN7]|nr:protein kinase [Frankia nepalensis]
MDRGRVAAALPGYKIGAQLGAGGFGLVVVGRHKRLRRDVAIKVIPAEAAMVGGEFTSEAEMLASLDHPHIVRVHDYLEADGLGLIVMELLGGGTLTSRWRDLSQPEICAVGLAIAAGLAHAHERGILHRDIKMANVLFDTAGMAKLGDFGIARMFTGSGVTGAPHGAGTPLYMAPEQIAGGRLSPATDLYALGVVLYQLLTGAPPFDPTLSPPQLWHQHLTSPPPPVHGVPRRVTDVVLRTLAKDPADRYPDADSFAAALAAAAVAVYGPAWLADTGLPLQLTDPVRHVAVPSLPTIPPRTTGSSARPRRATADALLATPATTGTGAAGGLPPGTRRRRGALRSRRGKLLLVAAALVVTAASLLVVLLRGGQATGPLAATLIGHNGSVSSVAFSSDGVLLATASDDHTARLWDTSSRGSVDRPLATLTGHGDWVNAATFSPDGRLLATASDDHTARLWDTSSRGSVDRPLAVLIGHTDLVYDAAFSPDGRLLATASYDGTALLWDTSRRGSIAQPLATFAGHTDWVDNVAFSPDGGLLATASYDGTVQLWTTSSRGNVTRPLTTLTGHSDGIYDVAFSPDGRLLATTDGTGSTRLWDTSSRGTVDRAPAILLGYGDWILDVTFSPDGRLLATASDGGNAQLWSASSRGALDRPLATLTGHTGAVNSVMFSPDGRLLATGDNSNARLWSTSSRGSVDQPLATLTGPTETPDDAVSGSHRSVAFSPDGRLLATATGVDGTARLWYVDAVD